MEEIIDEYSNFINNEILNDEEILNPEEEAKIREELKRLGYL